MLGARPDMQFCSLHHRVLLFIIIIILTLNTAPGSSLDVCPTRAKLHHPVKLPCKHQCSGLLKWSLRENRDVVQAQCDQTSCRSEKGFTISHDQYLRGDLSLTITAADYSLRNVYACECRDSDFSYVRLVIETVFSQVQVKFDEDLKLHVSVPEPVEVIYKSSGSSDEVICRVNKTSLWCKDEYRDRTSLTYPEITLRHMEPRDSGRYTIRDTKNEEDIEIYAVSVEDKPGFPVWGIVLIVLSLLCCCVGVGIYLLQRKEAILKRRLGQVDQLVEQTAGGTEENIEEAEMSVHQLKEQYINTEYSDKVKLFCNEKKKQLQQHREHLRREELERRQQRVDHLVQQAEEGTKENIREAKESLDQLKQQYENTEYSDKVSMFCRAKRKQLVNRRLLQLEQLVQQAEEGQEENIREAEQQINQLEKQYSEYSQRVSSFCSAKRRQLNWYRVQHSNEERLVNERRKLNIRLLHVNQLVQQAEGGTEQNIRGAEKELDHLEQQYKNKEYSEQIKFICRVKRIQLKKTRGQPSNEQRPVCGDGELQRQQQQVEQSVLQAKDGTLENIREAKVEIDHLEQMQYKNTEDVPVPVTAFSMLMRAELYWYRLLNSDEEQIMTEKTEMKKKLEKVMDGLQKLRDGAKQKQKIPSSTEVDEMQEDLKEIEKWCGEMKKEINDLMEQKDGVV